MKTEFVPYELALRMKQLGFDENRFAYYYLHKDKPLLETQGSYDFGTHSNSVTAPLYQQAFRWFREKYRLHSCIISDNCIKDTYGYHVDFLTKEDKDLYMVEGVAESEVVLGFNTPKEAELACLEKLIEIVEQSKSE